MNLIITSVFNLVLGVVYSVISLILIPIDALLNLLLPDTAAAFSQVSDFFSLIGTYIGWGISLTGIPTVALELLAGYWLFTLTAPIQVWVIKLGLSWYRTLKP